MTTKTKNRYFLPAGIYMVSFILYTCTSDKGPAPQDCNSNPVTIQSINSTQATCGHLDGSLKVTASGGDGNYQYSIDGVKFQPENSFNSLAAGNYSVSVKDGNNCMITGTTSVENNAGLVLSTQSTNAGCGISGGSVTITVTGGKQPYQYGIVGQVAQNGNIISDLSGGKYSVFAEDADGCQVVETVKVMNGTSLNDDVMPILQTSCTLSGCHDGKSGLPDWNDKETVIANASLIKQKTQDGTMPKGGTLPAKDIQIIACWVDDGAKNN